jgi:hypothetical protein
VATQPLVVQLVRPDPQAHNQLHTVRSHDSDGEEEEEARQEPSLPQRERQPHNARTNDGVHVVEHRARN